MSTLKLPSGPVTHDNKDETIESIYIGRCFKDETERLGKLYEMCTGMTKGVKS